MFDNVYKQPLEDGELLLLIFALALSFSSPHIWKFVSSVNTSLLKGQFIMTMIQFFLYYHSLQQLPPPFFKQLIVSIPFINRYVTNDSAIIKDNIDFIVLFAILSIVPIIKRPAALINIYIDLVVAKKMWYTPVPKPHFLATSSNQWDIFINYLEATHKDKNLMSELQILGSRWGL